MASIEQNTALPIYNADGTRFHDLELKKVVVDSVVMSLSDKITGEVCYKDNTLGFTMQEYVKYRRNEDEDYTKYFLVNPPTLVREGMVSDNSDLKGMTRYSFEFYHPMYMLGNFPFTDVAVSSDEKKYLSESKEFSWIGKPADYVAKLNKNLEGTEWVVVLSSRFPEGLENQLSEVLKFDKNTIADALKTGYDTWGVPFVIDNLREGEYYNANHIDYYSASGGSKRYVVVFGLPSNEILVEEDNNQVPFVFQFGKGVGLKNNSRNPRNNKIVTRIAGYGSEKNVPFGYPQIQWYGDSRWEFTDYEGSTINYDSEGKVTNTPKAGAYPLYKGIVGGAYVTLIHHPFTRSHLMPSIYSQSVFNKVSPYLANGNANPDYNPNLQLIDYYDAITDSEFTYINEINSGAPSYEIHEFDVKPELRDGEDKTITSAVPLNGDLTESDSWNDNMDEDGNFEQSYFKVTLPALGFDIYACASITEEMQINMRSGACIGCTFNVQVDWEDYKQNFYDEDGNFDPVIGSGHPRNATKYPDSTSSAISLILQKENSTFGTLMPNIYQHPAAGDAFVILGISLPLSYITNAELRLDLEMKSFMLENNVHYFDYPLKFDEHFLTTHEDILKQITTNTVVRFRFEGEEEPLELFVKQLTVKYGEGVLPKYDITLTDNVEVVLNQIGKVADSVERLGAIVAVLRQTYSRSIWMELDKKLSKDKNDYTPYRLRMGGATVDTDLYVGRGATIGGNAIIGSDATIVGDVEIDGDTQHVGDMTFGSKNPNDETSYSQNVKGCKIYWNGSGWSIETDYIAVNKRMYAKSIQVNEVTHVGGENLLTDASCVVDFVSTHFLGGTFQFGDGWNTQGFYRVFFRKKNGEGRVIYNKWRVGDQAYCQVFNIDAGESENFSNKYYWRLVTGTSNLSGGEMTGTGAYTDQETEDLLDEYHFIDISFNIADLSGDQRMDSSAGSIPQVEDPIVQLGFRPTTQADDNDAALKDERQGATLISGGGKWKRAIVMWEGIDSFVLPTPKVILSPSRVDMTVDSLRIKTSGSGSKPISDYVSETQSQFLIFETETAAVPTLSNAPYTSWSEEERELYSTEPNNAVILNSDGRTWRFVKSGNTYAFEEFTDPWLLAQHKTIDNILDDGVITADEIPQLQQTSATIVAQCQKVMTEFNTSNATYIDSPLYTPYNNYISSFNVLCSRTQGSEGYFYEISLMSPPIYLQNYTGSGVTKYRATRSNIQAAITTNAIRYDVWNKAYAKWESQQQAVAASNDVLDAAQDYVDEKIEGIMENTVDSYLEELIEDYINNNTQLATHSEITSIDESITALTTWVGSSAGSFGTSGLRTYLDSLFVGVAAVEMEEDAIGNILYYNSAGYVVGKDAVGVYYTDGDGVKHYYDNSQDESIVDYGKPRIANISKTGLVTEERFAALTTRVTNAEGQIVSRATISAWISDAFNSGENAEKLKSHILITADDVKIESGNKALGDYFSLNNGNLWCQNITVEGIINNLINVIDVANNVNADKLIEPVNIEGNLVGDIDDDCLDVLRLPDVVKIKSFRDRDILLPYYIQTIDQCRTLTKYSTGGVHLILPDELRKLVGRRITLIVEGDINKHRYLKGAKLLYPYDASNSGLRFVANGVNEFMVPDNVNQDFDLRYDQVIHLEFRLCSFWQLVNGSYTHFGYGYAWTGYSSATTSNQTDGLDVAWTDEEEEE